MAKLIAIKTYCFTNEIVSGEVIRSIHNTKGKGIYFYVTKEKYEGRYYGCTSGEGPAKNPSYWDFCNAQVYRTKYGDDAAELFIPLSWVDEWLYGIQCECPDDHTLVLPSGEQMDVGLATATLMDYDPRLPESFYFSLSHGFNKPAPNITVDDVWDSLSSADCATVQGSLSSTDCVTAQDLADYSIYTNNNKEKKSMNLNLSTSLTKNLRCGKAGVGYGISLFDGSICYKGHSYNGSALVETAGFEIDASDFLFIMPCTEIKKGDIVALQNDVAYYDGKEFISLTSGAKTEYVPVSCFGMTFYSVVRNMLGNFGNTNSANPMANLLPLMLLDKSGDNDDLMKIMLLMNGGLNFNFGAKSDKKSE